MKHWEFKVHKATFTFYTAPGQSSDAAALMRQHSWRLIRELNSNTSHRRVQQGHRTRQMPLLVGLPPLESRNAGPCTNTTCTSHLAVCIPRSPVCGCANGVEVTKRYVLFLSSIPSLLIILCFTSHWIKWPERKSSWAGLLSGVTADCNGTAAVGTLPCRVECASFTQTGQTYRASTYSRETQSTRTQSHPREKRS